MKTHYKLSAELIKQIYLQVCEEDRGRIEAEVPKLFKPESEIIPHNFYTNREAYMNRRYLFSFTETPTGDNSASCYGFTPSGEWFEDRRFANDLIPADPAIVESALISEAKRRGYEKGVVFLSVLSACKSTCSGEFHYANKALYSKGMSIFEDGIWATILPKKQLTMSELREIVGEDFEIKAD